MKTVIAILSVLQAPSGAVTVEQPKDLARLPNAGEVAEFVRAGCDATYRPRVVREALVQSNDVLLVSVDDVSCGYYVGTPTCSFTLATKSPNGASQEHRVVDEFFGWKANGQLETVIVLFHPRAE